MFSWVRFSVFSFLVLVVACGEGSESFSPESTLVQQTRSLAGFRPGGRVGTHGMIVFGEPGGRIYLSHIPMFHGPHDVQAVLEVELGTTQPSLSDRLHTFLPDTFSLDDLLLGRIDTLSGTLFSGNFESTGVPVQKVYAKVKRVLISKVLQANTPKMALTYWMFGTAQQAYLVHRIEKAPSFDQVLAVRPLGALTNAPMDAGVSIALPGRDDLAEERLSVGPVTAVIETGRVFPLEVVRELSFLKGPHFVPGAP